MIFVTEAGADRRHMPRREQPLAAQAQINIVTSGGRQTEFGIAELAPVQQRDIGSPPAVTDMPRRVEPAYAEHQMREIAEVIQPVEVADADQRRVADAGCAGRRSPVKENEFKSLEYQISAVGKCRHTVGRVKQIIRRKLTSLAIGFCMSRWRLWFELHTLTPKNDDDLVLVPETR